MRVNSINAWERFVDDFFGGSTLSSCNEGDVVKRSMYLWADCPYRIGGITVRTSKKIDTLLLAIAATLVIVVANGCGGEDNPNPAPTTTTVEAPTFPAEAPINVEATDVTVE